MYLEAVEQAVSIEKMNNTSFNPSTCTIKEDGILNCEGTNVQVEVKGEKPLKGNIIFQSGKIINIRLEYKNNKIILKNEKGNLEYFDYNRNSDMNFIVEGIKEQKTTTGKNLFDLTVDNVTLTGKNSKLTSIENGIEISYNDVRDSYVTLNYELLPNTTYTVNFDMYINSSETSWGFQALCVYTDDAVWYKPDVDGALFTNGNITKTFTTPDTENTIHIVLVATAMNDDAIGVTRFTNFMLSLGSDATYELYTNGPTPNPTHPQEIPLAGTLNTKTGKYDIGVTASIEGGKSQTLTLTSPVKLTKWDKLVKRDGVWGWSIWNEKYILSASKISDVTYKSSTSCVLNFNVPNATHLGAVMSNRVIRGGRIDTNENVNHTRIYDGVLQVRLAYPEGVGIDNTNSEIKNAFKPIFEEKEFVFFYPTAEEQSFIPLPEEEQTLLYKLKL